MDCLATSVSYTDAAVFSHIVLDYIDASPKLAPFYEHTVDLNGIRNAINNRSNFDTKRDLLVETLISQYAGLPLTIKAQENIDSLASPQTFTITTAHQNNLFTGPLYFIYKIVHTIKLASYLKESIPDCHFVPVFYIGSEDADIEELNHIYSGKEKLVWQTDQTGAVGKMKIDRKVIRLIEQLEGRLGVLEHGAEVSNVLRKHYQEGITLSEATFRMLNDLFGAYGLIVLQPDNSKLKRSVIDLLKNELLNQPSKNIVEAVTEQLHHAGYKEQAHARNINLFYLTENSRERIEMVNDVWKVTNSDTVFTQDQLVTELNDHPERFSPNVILRGLYQETILPNVVTIGGGGETAYWLQLKTLFNFFNVPYPVLVLRNSFMLVEKKQADHLKKLGFDLEHLFLSSDDLLNLVVKRESLNPTNLNGILPAITLMYEDLKKQASAVDTSLAKHVDALKTLSLHKLQQLEKKMLRAEKRKYTDHERQIRKIKEELFPGNGLQERRENVLYYLAKYGRIFIDALIEKSPALEQKFTILQLPKDLEG